MFISSVLVGFSAGLAAVVLKTFVHYVFLVASLLNSFADLKYFFLCLPILGIFLTTVVVKRVLGGHLQKEIGRAHV